MSDPPFQRQYLHFPLALFPSISVQSAFAIPSGPIKASGNSDESAPLSTNARTAGTVPPGPRISIVIAGARSVIAIARYGSGFGLVEAGRRVALRDVEDGVDLGLRFSDLAK